MLTLACMFSIRRMKAEGLLSEMDQSEPRSLTKEKTNRALYLCRLFYVRWASTGLCSSPPCNSGSGDLPCCGDS